MGIIRMRTGVCGVIMILMLVSFSGCTEEEKENTNPPKGWVSSKGHSSIIFFDVKTDKDVYSENDLVNVSVLLVSESDDNISFLNSGYIIEVLNSKKEQVGVYDQRCRCRHYTEIPANSSTNLVNWSWNQTTFEYPNFSLVNRGQSLNITCWFSVVNLSYYNPYGWKTIWLK